MAPLDLVPRTNQASIAVKFSALRALMAAHQLDSYLVPSADEHLNEYLPEAKQRRAWVSGFTGSAGELLVGREQAWLFVDSRYHEQADLEVDPSLVQVVKLGLDEQKTLIETLEMLGDTATEANTVHRLGFDPFTLAIAQFQTYEKQLAGVEPLPGAELVDQIRTQTPWVESDPIPPYGNSKLFQLPDELTGETIKQKLTRVREAMQKAKTDLLPIAKLDQVAWLFNLRGQDIPYNPVFIAYAIVTLEQAFLFTNLARIEPEVRQAIADQVTLLPYEQYPETLKTLSQANKLRVLLDPQGITLGTYHLLVEDRQDLARSKVKIVEKANPIEGMKARKNAVELEQMQAANLKASRAKTCTLKWICDQLDQDRTLQERRLSELDVAQAIAQFYRQEAGYQGLSFNTIAAAGTNSSIVHYGTPSPDTILQPGEFLLLDSGAQYWGGTTDDTRTLIVGDPTPEQIQRYTEVLKAHINCAGQRFPKGTSGIQLDGIARSDLWLSGLDYGHGTGHGVGAFLNVHEGPNGISKRAQALLEPGMITSIEPGFYQPGWGGIRIENLYVVKDLSEAKDSQTNAAITAWYGFEPLTYIPFEHRLIDWNRLEPRQQKWLAHYNEAVVEKLAPTLDSSEAEWLKEACNLDQHEFDRI